MGTVSIVVFFLLSFSLLLDPKEEGESCLDAFRHSATSLPPGATHGACYNRASQEGDRV
jgi:hypothetical protein